MHADLPSSPLRWTLALSALLALGCGQEPTAPSAPTPSTTPVTTSTASAGVVSVTVGTAGDDAPDLDACGALSDSDDRCGPITQLFAAIPGDVCDPGLPDWSPSANAMDHLSWRTFIALLWPARPGAPGVPDPAFGPGARLDELRSRPAVFETWPSADDFAALGAQLDDDDPLLPSDWGKPVPLPSGCPTDSDLRVLRHTGKVRPETAAALAGTAAAAAYGGPAVDQNGHMLFVETRFNRPIWDVITGGGYDAPGALRRGLDYPNNLGDTGYREGAVAVQAAWRPLSDSEASSGAFHVSRVLLFQDGGAERPGTCDPTYVGLVGLLIAHKTATGGDDWIWSAFDHGSAAPSPSGVRTEGFFLSSGACAGVSTTGCAGAVPPVGDALACCPNTDLHGPLGASSRLMEDRKPTDLHHVDAVDGGCQAQFATALTMTPLENFLLVGTQWWADPEAESLEHGPDPEVLRSVTLQPWAVSWDEGEQRVASSCIGCHRQGEDGLFLLSSLAVAPPDSPESGETASPSEPPSAPE